jgi:hypothetical protein
MDVAEIPKLALQAHSLQTVQVSLIFVNKEGQFIL